MNWSKRITLLGMMILLIVALSACGGQAVPEAPEEAATQAAETGGEGATEEETAEEAADTGSDQAAGEDGIPRGGTINYTNLEPATLNPYLRPEQIAWQAIALISTGLVDLDNEGNWVLELAAEFPSEENGTVEVTEDGMVVTWKLRDGLKWSDGSPLTSDDLVFTWEVCSDETSGCAINAGFDKIERIETPDDVTAIVHYSEIYPAWKAQFRNGILPRKGTGEPSDMLQWEWNRTVNPTNGPFIVDEWVASDHITFVRNPYYWEEGKPYLDQINWLIVPDLEVQRQMLLGGEADFNAWIAGEPQVLETANAGFTIGGGGTPFFNRIQFNLKNPENLDEPHPLLGDVRVRKAILMAISREAVTYNWRVEGLFEPELITSLYDLWPQYACNMEPYPYDKEAARALLDEAGWTDEDGDGIRECNGCETAEDGTPLRLSVSTYANWGQEDNELVMVDELKDVGIDMYLQNYEATVMYSSWADGSFMYRGEFDVLWWDHDPGMPDPQFRTESFYASWNIPSEQNPSGMNMSRIDDEDIDAWATEAGQTIDVEKRHELYCQIADKVYHDYVSEAVQGVLSNFAFSNPALKGWHVNELYTPAGWDAEDWYLEQ
jgi:peptide/nickel transport system substrate-binding protein